MIIERNNEGTCSIKTIVEIENNKIIDCKIIGGCNGNLEGICQLVKGQDVDTVIEKLQGIRCGFKPTSCPDQLAKALLKYKEQVY